MSYKPVNVLPSMYVMGVKINQEKKPVLAETVSDFLNTSSGKKIFTPNPEMLVIARGNEKFREALNNADLSLCDGFGLKLVSGGKLTRWPGSDFVFDLCAEAVKEKKSIYLLGTSSIIYLKKAVEELRALYPNIKIVGFDVGPQITIKNGESEYDELENRKAIDKINSSGAEILIVAFGQVKQELWISENIYKMNKLKIAVGVGGAIDYISGLTRRAPKLIRYLGMEWLYRLVREPWRLKRIYNATFVFLYYFLKDKYAR